MSALWVFLLLTACACSTHGQLDLPTVHINDCGGTIIAGQSCTLVCGVSGIGNSNPIITYQWTKNNGTTQTQVGNGSNTLSFTSLRLSDAGRYTCQVTVGSDMYGYSEYIAIQIPVPVSANITSIPASPIRPIGTANVTLTCIVELSQVVDTPVTVNTVWTGPNGFTTTSTGQSMESTTTYTSTATVTSFGREKSGNYTCKTILSSSSLFLTNSRQHSKAAYITVGVHLSLRNTIYANNSIIFFSEIGESINRDTRERIIPPHSLQCITDKMYCCRIYLAGEWYFPNASRVLSLGSGYTVYRTRGYDDGSVNLNRRNDSDLVSETGLFCCMVPDAKDNNQTLCANIVTVRVNDHGVNTAGEAYVLECSVDRMSESITYQWLDEEGNSIISGGLISITNSTSASFLQFSPLHQSHEGDYTCNATIAEAAKSKSFYVSVNVPLASAQISDGGTLPVLGLSLNLTCNIILGAHNLNPNITYLWKKNSIQIMDNISTLSFQSLRLSDAGKYTCSITVRSPYLHNEITAVTSHSLILEFPAPLAITIASDKPNPIRPVGSAITLFCTVALSSAVDVPVTVTFQLSNPDGNPLSTAPPSVSGSTYSSAALISSFGRNQSGIYSCAVNTSSIFNSPFITGSKTISGTYRITAGVYLSLKGAVYANNSLITVTEIEEGGDSMKCLTDRRPCCRRPGIGEWYFPNGTAVPIPYAAATSFYRLRSSEGYVYLNRLNSDITHPVGRFCCVVPDALDDIQTLCINIILVRIVDNGTPPTAGQKYFLTCNVSGAENLDPTITYLWIKNNGTQTYIGTNSRVLSFSSLRLSDAGQYSCEVIVNSHLLHNSINKTSRQFEVHLPVPQPIVGLVSDIPNPIRSGSSPVLTCAVEFSPAVDVPVVVSTVWTGLDGLMMMSAAPPVMKSFTHYTSKVKLNYVESADSGNYTCTVSIGGKTRASVGKIVIIGDGMFQIQLKNADVCQPWYKSAHPDMEADLYKYHIEEALVEAIESRCECHFPKANLLKALFSCASSPNLTTYRSALIGTHNFNATQLIGFIQDWVTSAPWVNIKDYSVWLESSCPVAITSLKEPECGEVS